MRKQTMFKQLFIALTLLAVISFFGCEKKTDEIQDEIKTENLPPDTSSIDPPDMVEPVVEEIVVAVIPDLKGTWTGTFDGKFTTLKITEQMDSSFSGNISINYKQSLHQNVKGNFSPNTLKISMIDQLHSKFMGKYSGTMSEDFKTFAGAFTKNRDGSQYSFNLKKK